MLSNKTNDMLLKPYTLVGTYTDFMGRKFGVIKRDCPMCEHKSCVYPILDHWTIGACEHCGHIRQVPPQNELTDPDGNPSEKRFLIDLINTCLLPKPEKKIVFSGDIKSRGIYY